MKESKLTKGMLYVLMANIVNLIFTLATNFLLPKYLSVDTYAAIKTFQLYVTYIGFFHFGFVDGVYLKFGGKNLGALDKKETMRSLATLRIFQFLLSLFFILFALVIDDMILLMFSLAILPLNVTSYFKMLYQSVGEFQKYSKITNYVAVLTFVVNMILLFFFRSASFMAYLFWYVLIDLFVWFLLEFSFCKVLNEKIRLFYFSFQEFFSNIKSGFSLMLGNFASFILTGLDRWFVKILMSTISFAQYSFAVSVENMLNVALTPISIPLYNYFCNEDSSKKINFVYQGMVLFGVVIVSSAFVVKFILEVFLTNYLDSSVIIFYLFAAQIFQILIKSVYVNLYKARKQQKKYFHRLLFVVFSGIVFNIVFYLLLKNISAFAIGTLFSSILWFLFSRWDFKDIGNQFQLFLFLILETLLFLSCGILLNSIWGFLCYVIGSLFFSFIFMGDYIINLFKMLKSKILSK